MKADSAELYRLTVTFNSAVLITFI